MIEVFCEANRWTEVERYAGLAPSTKRYTTTPPTRVSWRWISFGVLFLWLGSFDGSSCITLLPSAYLSLQFSPAADTVVTVADGPC
jgi:hypothetical protein